MAIFPVLFIIAVLLIMTFITGIWIFLLKGLFATWTAMKAQNAYNDAQPIVRVSARVVAKRMQTTGTTATSGPIIVENPMPGSGVPVTITPPMGGNVTTWYHVTFEIDSGERLEFAVDGSEYGQLVEGDEGALSHQGTRYEGFERQIKHSAQ